MSQPIQGSARVRIEADTSRVVPDVVAAVRQAVAQAQAAVRDGFAEAGQAAAESLGGISAALDDLTLDADPTPLVEAVAQATDAVEDLDDTAADVVLDADAAPLQAEVAQATDAVEDLDDAAAQVVLDGDATPLVQEVDRAKEAAGSLRGAFDVALGAGVVGISALSAATITAGVNFNSLSQAVHQGLTAVLGTRDAARELIAEVIELNQTAAFSRQAFLGSTQVLVGFGVAADQVGTTLRAMENAIVAVGGGEEEFARITETLARVQSQGRATGQELQTLAGMGINLPAIIAETTSESIEQVQAALASGAIGLEEITRALNTRYAGAVEGYADTWEGAIGLVQAGLRNIGSALVEPFVGLEERGLGVDLLGSLANVLFAVQRQATPLAQVLQFRLTPAVGRITGALDTLAEHIDGLDFDSFFARVERGLPAVAGLASAITAAGGSAALSAVGLSSLAGVLNPVAAGVTAVVLASPELRGLLVDLLEAVVPLVPPLTELATITAGGLSQALAAVVPLLEPLVSLVDVLVTGFTALPEPVQTATLALTAMVLLAPQLRTFGSAISRLPAQLTTAAAGLRTAATRLSGVRGALTGIVGALGGPWGLAITAGVAGLAALGSAARDSRPPVSDLVEDLERFAETGRVTGVLVGAFGDDLSNLGEQFERATSPIGRSDGALASFFNFLKLGVHDVNVANDAFADLDTALAQLVESGDAATAAEVVADLADKLGLSGEETGQLLELLPEYVRQMDRHNERVTDAAEEQGTLAAAIGDVTGAMQAQADEVRSQIDPLFAYHQAVQEVDAAQQAYNQALADFGPQSAEAEAAAFDLALAASDVENTAKGAADVFSREMPPALRRSLELIGATTPQLEGVEQAWRDTGGAARDYVGDYLARAVVDGDEQAMAAFQQLLGAADKYEARRVAKLFLEGDEEVRDRLAEILREMDAIPRDITSTVTFQRRGDLSVPGGPAHPRALGGIIDRPELAVLGEDWRREVVIPLTRPERALELTLQSGLLDVIADAMRTAPSGARSKVHSSLLDSGQTLALAAGMIAQMASSPAASLTAAGGQIDHEAVRELAGAITTATRQAGTPPASPPEPVVRGRRDSEERMVNQFTINQVDDPRATAQQIINRLMWGL